MKRLTLWLLLFIAIIAQTVYIGAQETVDININGEVYSQPMPTVVDKLQELVRGLADTINNMSQTYIEGDKQIVVNLGTVTDQVDTTIAKVDTVIDTTADAQKQMEQIKALGIKIDGIADKLNSIGPQQPKFLVGVIPALHLDKEGVNFNVGPYVGVQLFDLLQAGIMVLIQPTTPAQCTIGAFVGFKF